MSARMKNPVLVLPETLKALQAVEKSTESADLPLLLRKLVQLRASQINGCSVCTDMHARELKQAGDSDQRLWSVAAWRDTVCFSAAERAALDLTEHLTRTADRPDPVPDAVWDACARHFDETALAALVVQIGSINLWNRLNIAIKQVAGAWQK